ncbi:hypothetical protein EV175_003868 [Coemansia sp. RSA 1933]|nr:hypothetical protein EV175_003868 [Coemansia sp. RSA 1933]
MVLKDTPHKPKPGGEKSASHFSTNKEALKKLRKRAAADQRKAHLVNCDAVVDCAKPTSLAASNAADKLAESIHRALESELLLAARGGRDTSVETRSSTAAISSREKVWFRKFHTWLRGCLPKGKRPEADIATAYNALVRYIAIGVEKAMASASTSSAKPKRVLIPCNVDKKPSDSDEDIRVDVAFVARDNTGSMERLERAGFCNTLILTEIKAHVKLQNDAYDQLFQYTRQLYATQHNRRFAWGLTLCDTVAHVVLFTNDHAIASANMDFRTEVGRKEFVQMMVNFSFCNLERLGYDDSIRWVESAKCWEIDCPAFSDETGASATINKYYSKGPSKLVADRLFGRHTRGFLASSDPRSADSPDTFIKDAWTYSKGTAGDPRDEVAMLRDIDSALSKEEYADLLHVKFQSGGIVKLGQKNDDTRAMLGSAYDDIIHAVCMKENDTLAVKLESLDVGSNSTTVGHTDQSTDDPAFPRTHKRISTSPVGRSIFSLSSPYELIVVLVDAMRTHAAILKECSILHRDLSTNNILAVGSGRSVRGLLIDFDCALRLDRVASDEWKRRPERTGTLPFMSMGNLAKSDVPRSELDDWESVLYILCWMGINGANEEERDVRYQQYRQLVKDDSTYESPLERWETGSFLQVAKAKKADLVDVSRFRENVLDHFIDGEGYEVLKYLAEALHRAIFFNSELSDNCHGVYSKPFISTENEMCRFMNLVMGLRDNSKDSEDVDPFEQRYKYRGKISKNIQELFYNAGSVAKSRL